MKLFEKDIRAVGKGAYGAKSALFCGSIPFTGGGRTAQSHSDKTQEADRTAQSHSGETQEAAEPQKAIRAERRERARFQQKKMSTLFSPEISTAGLAAVPFL